MINWLLGSSATFLVVLGMNVKELTLGELNHIKSVLKHCEEEFRAIEDDGEWCDTDGTFQQIQEAFDILNPLIEKREDAK